MKHTLFFIINVDTFFLSHRKEVALAAQEAGFDVTVVANDTGKGKEIESLGLRFINLPNVKSIKNIFSEFGIFLFLLSLYKKHRPDIVHHVGLKLILYGTIVARFMAIRGIVNAVSGMGILFSHE